MWCEAAVAIDLAGEPLYWHTPPGREIGKVPDSRDFWLLLREHKTNLLGVAHSHPGGGIPGPSDEDITTFSAIERGLGKWLQWWITSADAIVVCTWEGPHKFDYKVQLVEETSWSPELRRISE